MEITGRTELNINPLSQKLDAYYPILSQTSLDIQSTKGAWLYKLEALTAKNGKRDILVLQEGQNTLFMV